MKNILLVLALALLTSACCQQVETDKPQKPKKSVFRETINGFTGKTSVDTLKRAKPKIEAAAETEQQKRQDLDELTKP